MENENVNSSERYRRKIYSLIFHNIFSLLAETLIFIKTTIINQIKILSDFSVKIKSKIYMKRYFKHIFHNHARVYRRWVEIFVREIWCNKAMFVNVLLFKEFLKNSSPFPPLNT